MTVQTLEQRAVPSDLVSHYRREGWVKLPSVVPASDIAIIRRAASAAAVEMAPDRLDLTMSGTAPVTKPSAFLETARKMFRNETDLRLQYPELLPVVGRLAVLARALMGREVRVLQDQTFTKPPTCEGGLATPWHQDYSYYPIDRRGLFGFWIPLQEVTPQTGALRFLPRSHRLGPLGRIIGEREDSLEAILSPEDLEIVGEPVCNTLEVGDLTVHNGLMLHSACPNTSPHPRAAWTVLFIPAETRWTGAPCGHKRLNDAGLDLLGHFDDPSFSAS